jgi:squalene-associated FAD-dependent desaturase
VNVVVGGGWAGIAAAVELARNGRPVTLVEAADRLGGRARAVDYRHYRVDNGQHLIIGAYRSLLDLLAIVGVDENRAFERHPLELRLHSLHRPDIRLRPPPLPAPFHLPAGLLCADGLDIREKWRALLFCLHISRRRPAADCSVQTMLERTKQPPHLIQRLWEPLCLATLNTPPAQASAEVFCRVLNDAFAHRRSDADMLFPRSDLGLLLPEPARDYITRRGGRVLPGERAVALNAGAGRIDSVTLANGDTLAAEQIILALPPEACLRLIEPLPAFAAIAANLRRIDSAPICTVYFQYPAQVRLPFPLIGLHGGPNGSTAQWLCDLHDAGQPGLISAVISGTGEHMDLPRAQLVARVAAELAAYFPGWPAPVDGFVLRERRATFLSSVGVNALRPGADTPYANCQLAGDATATGYPATLEGAVRSGFACAHRILVTADPTAPSDPIGVGGTHYKALPGGG